MSSFVRQLQKWLFGSRKVQVQIVGPEFAGRTTLLYTLMNLGEPLPSTGVPLSWADYDRKTLDYPAGWEFDIVDVWDGCSKFRLKHDLFHFMTKETIVWYVHNCYSTNDNESSAEDITMWIKMYIKGMKEKGAKYIWIIMSKQDKLAPAEREAIVAEQKEALVTFLQKEAKPAGITWFWVDEPGFNMLEGKKYVMPFLKGVTETLTNMGKTLRQQKKEPKNDNSGKGKTATTTIAADLLGKKSKNGDTQKTIALREKALADDTLRARLEEVEKGGSENLRDAEAFWDRFMSANLTSWSHVDHLEAGYLVLLQSIEQKRGLLKTASVFLEHLARLREMRPDVFRNTAHFTMTAFWVMQLRIAIFNFQFPDDDHDEATTTTTVNGPDRDPSPLPPTAHDFREVVLHSPSLLDTRLWMEYYTKETLFSAQAREDFVMPDVKPFPQVTKPVLARVVGKGDDKGNEKDGEVEDEAGKELVDLSSEAEL